MKRNKSTIAIATSLIGLASIIAVNNSSAITYQDSTNVEFTFNPTINVSLSSSDLTIANLAPGGTSDSNVITATVSTNAGYGYYLSATTGTAGGNANLTNTADSTYNFASLSSNAATLSAIPDNKWGYSYSTDNGSTWISGDYGSALSGYNGLPLDNDDSGATGVKLLSSDSFAGSGSVQFKLGARAATDQAAGTYIGTVNFYAVTNPAPVTFNDAYAAAGKEKLLGYYKMQDATPAICTAVDEGQVGQVIDTRDNQVYKIAKLADNKCWMVENLNLAGGTALSAGDTDVTSSYISSFSTSSNLTKTGDTIVLPASSTSGFNTYNVSYVYNSGNKTSNCASPGCYSYYSWDAATLGSGRSISTNNTNAPHSICPKGWHLPNTYDGSGTAAEATDFRALMIALGGSNSVQTYNDSTTPTGTTISSALQASPYNFLLAGNYDGSSFYSGGSYGTYWSSTSVSSTYNARTLAFDSSSVNSAIGYNRHCGFSVRCLFSGQ